MASILVLAGVNGAGKSSIAGANLRASGGTYFNPDEETKLIQAKNPRYPEAKCNELAWTKGKDLLRAAINKNTDHAFETTLGANTIAGMLTEAAKKGMEVKIWYAGLETVELHIQRVAARVRNGGHDIPEAKIRERYGKSHENLVKLIPKLAQLSVYDNSAEAPPVDGRPPQPQLMLKMLRGKITYHVDLMSAPDWIKPMLVAAGVAKMRATRKPHLRVVK